MTSKVFTRARLRFPAGANVGAFAVAQPIATAEPAPYDPASFKSCADQVVTDTANGTKPKNDFKFLILKCCQDKGGVPTQDGSTVGCQAPAALSDPGTSAPP